MKICIVYYQYPLYEQGSYIQEQVDALCETNEKVILFATRFPRKSSFDKPRNLTIVWITHYRVPLIGDLLFNLEIFFKAFFNQTFRKVDIINIVSARGLLAGFLLNFFLKKPLVCTIEIINQRGISLIDEVYYSIQKKLYSNKLIDHIICWSNHYYKNYLSEWGVKQEKVTVIPGGIDTARYNPDIDGSEIRAKYPAKSLFVVFAKPMYAYNRKMAEFLLEVVEKVKNEVDVRLLLGSGEQKEMIENKISEKGLQGRVTFMPFVPITEIPKYLAAADIIVLPYTYEATVSRSLLEALAMGKPVITTKIGEISEVVKDHIHALLVKKDVNEVSAAVVELYRSVQLREKIGANARKLIEDNYSIEAIAAKTNNIFKRVIHDKQ